MEIFHPVLENLFKFSRNDFDFFDFTASVARSRRDLLPVLVLSVMRTNHCIIMRGSIVELHL